jgi:Response regulator of the LytR/AlgR family
MKLFLAIIEDDEINANILWCIIKKWSENTNIPVEISLLNNSNSFLNAYSKIALFDAIFLAIRDCNELETAKDIRKCDPFVPIVLLADTNEFITQGYDVWATKYLISLTNLLKTEDEVTRGNRLYAMCQESALTLRMDGKDIPNFFGSGSLQALANGSDKPDIGWHPRYEELLNPKNGDNDDEHS